jgi:histidyl-tRNA synthetase
LGGDPVPAIGWALGEERIVEIMRVQQLVTTEGQPDVYLVLAGAAAEALGLGLAEQLRDALPGLKVEANCGGGSFKSQMKRADRSGARYAVIVGDDEAARRTAALKSLRDATGQREVALADLGTELERVLRPAAA